MKANTFSVYTLAMAAAFVSLAAGQDLQRQPARKPVPGLVQFSGTLPDAAAMPAVGVTFALYEEQEGGVPIWVEIQNVSTDESGRYTVLLGATRPEGLPVELFTSGGARWLGIQPERQPEQPRVLLLSVPYALKAADAETVGGLPPSAFRLAGPPNAPARTESTAAGDSGATLETSLGGSGTPNFLPIWLTTSTLGNSALAQTGSKVGLGTRLPSIYTAPPVHSRQSQAALPQLPSWAVHPLPPE